MEDLPEEFPCTFTTWQYVYDLCRATATAVDRSPFTPDVVVALARGGWFAGRCLCDFLGIEDLTSLKVEHYVGTARSTAEPQIRYPAATGSVEDKAVLIVDDIADTGASIRRAHAHIAERDPATVATATLQLLGTSDIEPDFVGERLDEWVWVIYPWNVIEDLTDLITGVMEKATATTFTADDIRHHLRAYHEIDPIAMEVAQPDRFHEAIDILERRDRIQHTEAGWQLAT